ncbi:MAG: Crp/Fnr family transcriptional regulator [Terrisporobacter othiniensis]|uniref:CRP-like cAMP-activated global transcriptional regulator n=1 Tax=Terrisporobacter petrolearius TaxID=1460447 RepID=A0ABZ3FFA4_9FIRM|nr:Crp/Fnr family transcriptional regulator [Terrisporobacter petrolearius]MDU4861085.1 Crp/Fnr family transcriptional regulator [Terrisporobacter othiniensis]MDU6994719.1 Crp/Fnr family transcriptional regulator [Terrisporobacter othiniensis]UPA32069.1 Crp/Fnr family transcriptional regulator [Terrisporobacter glycolicus]
MNSIEVFKNIKEESKVNLEKILKTRKLSKKEILFYERDMVDKIYFIKEGKISLFKINESGERKVIFILPKGQMINDIFIDEKKTSAVSCEAFEKSILLECSSKDFMNIMENDFILTKNVLNHLQNINRRLYRQLKNSISIRMDKKLAAKLYRMGREFGVEKDEWTLINANLTITYIADMLGCKRETLSRSMKVLQDENLVKIENKKVYIKKHELSSYFKNT